MQNTKSGTSQGQSGSGTTQGQSGSSTSQGQGQSGSNIRSQGSATGMYGSESQSSSSRGMAGEFRTFFADIEELIQSMTSMSGEDLARAKAKLAARVNEAKQSIEQMSGVIAERARNTARAANGYVHEHTWQAIGIGAAVGLLLGMVVRHRK
jgi:ElaB/YqjD/DUF883 family membrane-anchored ribosome-binding protein